MRWVVFFFLEKMAKNQFFGKKQFVKSLKKIELKMLKFLENHDTRNGIFFFCPILSQFSKILPKKIRPKSAKKVILAKKNHVFCLILSQISKILPKLEM